MSGPLSGLRILQIGEGKAVAYAGKLLRDLGAECIQIEPPGGDPLRGYGPFPADLPDAKHSGLFVWLSGGKRGVELDLRTPEDRTRFEALLDEADILLHSYQPIEAHALGLDADAVRRGRPSLIVTAVTPFGSTGPYADWRGHALQAYAGSGVAYRLGDPEDTPLTAPLDLAEIQFGGVHAAAATALAIVHRDRTGEGQFVDVGVMDAVTSGVAGIGFERVVYGGYPTPVRGGRRFGGGAWGIYETKDGNFDVVTLMDRQWHSFLERMAGDPEWGRRPEYASVQPAVTRDLTAPQVEALRGHLAAWFREHTTADIWEQTRALRISFQPVHTVADVLASEHLAAREFLVRAPGVEPPLRVPGAPYRFSVTAWEPPGAPPEPKDAPAERWRAERPAVAARRTGSTHSGSLLLSGIRVIDLGQVWAGPLLARYLADWGADVIAVETASRPRALPGQSDPSHPGAWEWLYRNRRSIQLNLAETEGRRLFRSLLGTADVMIDNFAARVMPALGLDYADLLAEHPHLVICALSASGRDGPWADLLSYGPTLTALHGTKSLYGYPDGRLVEDASELDPISAGYGMLAVMSALHHRNLTGEGQLIELAQSEAGLCGIAEAIIELEWNGRAMGPQGNTHRVLAPHGIYPCAGDQWIAIACASDEEWRAVAQTTGHPDWLERIAFATAASRRAARVELDAAISKWTRGQEASLLAARLQAAGVAAMPVLSAIEVVTDPHHQHRGEHFDLCPEFPGDRLYDGNPWHLSAARPRLRLPAPVPGAHNEEVLGQLLGLTPEEVARLQAAGIVA